MKTILGVLGVIVFLLAAWAVFPMFLEGADAINSTTNATEYTGLLDIVHLSPAIIFVIILGVAFVSFGGLYLAKIWRERGL